MFKYAWIAFLLVVLNACNVHAGGPDSGQKAAAERFFRGVYGGDPTVVDELAGEDIVISYAIFKRLFNTPELRGREAARRFAAGFATRWTDARITIHDAVEEGDRVVLLWSFRARNVGSAREDTPPTQKEHEWGGITLYRFDASGKIVAEVGYESEPGAVEAESKADALKPR